MSDRRKCTIEEVEVGHSVSLILIIYVNVVFAFLTGLVFKGLFKFWHSKKRKEKKRIKLVRSGSRKNKSARNEQGSHYQGLAVKRMLFLKMHRNSEDQVDGYVEEGPYKKNNTQGGPPSTQKYLETDARKIKFKHKIGAGNFGEVWSATWMNSTVAVKTVLKQMANKEEFVEKFIEEINLMSGLNHPNIVLFLGACIQPPLICLMLEYCVHGNLIEFLQSAKDYDINISMHLILKMALDIARGIKYLHEKVNIIQRDIKGRNVLVDENLNAKISDFGLSRLKAEGENDNGLTACGTPAWTAPEVVRMEDYTEKVDVYSFGVVLWELFTRQEPYNGEGGIQVAYMAAEQGLRPEIPLHTPERYATLMKECWADSPSERPAFSQILERLFQMMKDESNPTKAAEFYFGTRKQITDTDLDSLLDESDIVHGVFAEDYDRILNTKRRNQDKSTTKLRKIHPLGQRDRLKGSGFSHSYHSNFGSLCGSTRSDLLVNPSGQGVSIFEESSGQLVKPSGSRLFLKSHLK